MGKSPESSKEIPIWPAEGSSRIPFQAYTDESIYKKELERLFYKAHWSYIGLEAEVPNPGDFKRTVVGERSVVMTRDMDGRIHVVENVSRIGACNSVASVTAIKKNWSAPTTNGITR